MTSQTWEDRADLMLYGRELANEGKRVRPYVDEDGCLYVLLFDETSPYGYFMLFNRRQMEVREQLLELGRQLAKDSSMDQRELKVMRLKGWKP